MGANDAPSGHCHSGDRAFVLVHRLVLGAGPDSFQQPRATGHRCDAPFLCADGVSGPAPGYIAQLFAGPPGTPVPSLTHLFPSTTFRSGVVADRYVVPIDVAVPGIPPGAQATLVMRAYVGEFTGPSSLTMESAPISITLGGGLLPPALESTQSRDPFPINPVVLDGQSGAPKTELDSNGPIDTQVGGLRPSRRRRRKIGRLSNIHRSLNSSPPSIRTGVASSQNPVAVRFIPRRRRFKG